MAYVLDTSAVIAFLFDEPGSDDVQQILEGDEGVTLAFITVMEARYIILRKVPARAEDLAAGLRASKARIVESDPEWGARAAEIKARGGLSLADAWIAALAIERDATLFHKDPEFERVAGLRTQFIS